MHIIRKMIHTEYKYQSIETSRTEMSVKNNRQEHWKYSYYCGPNVHDVKVSLTIIRDMEVKIKKDSNWPLQSWESQYLRWISCWWKEWQIRWLDIAKEKISEFEILTIELQNETQWEIKTTHTKKMSIWGLWDNSFQVVICM